MTSPTPQQVVYDLAMRLALTPYKWGGDDFAGVDCSGFVLLLLQAAGVFPYKRDASAAELAEHFQAKPYSHAIPRIFGTLMFYGEPKIIHVTFCLNGLQMISAEGGGSATKTREDAELANAFVKVLPIAARGTPKLMATPAYPW